MAKKRKSIASSLDEVDRTMYASFCSTANSLSQLYTQAMNHQKLSFQAGERHGLVRSLFSFLHMPCFWFWGLEICVMGFSIVISLPFCWTMLILFVGEGLASAFYFYFCFIFWWWIIVGFIVIVFIDFFLDTKNQFIPPKHENLQTPIQSRKPETAANIKLETSNRTKATNH